MKRKALDLLLLSILIPGAILAWQSGRERSRVSAQYERLRRVAGDLPIADPSKIYIRALDTGEPFHFAWRVYLPPNYQLEIRHDGSSSSSWSTSATEFIARVRIREDERGVLNIYTHFSGTSGRSSFGDASLAEFLRVHGREVQIEQLGGNEVDVVDPKQTASFLRLTFPGTLSKEAQEKLSPHARSFYPKLFQLEFGPKPPNP
ncbi:MAG: hypothetical protein P4L84_05620 [Isosphaeraceae bacterium]|nr:hypothetical protein [Isosphaeraceae bacterium]